MHNDDGENASIPSYKAGHENSTSTAYYAEGFGSYSANLPTLSTVSSQESLELSKISPYLCVG